MTREQRVNVSHQWAMRRPDGTQFVPPINPWPEGLPSELTHVDFIYVCNEVSAKPPRVASGPSYQGGKWLLFAKRADVDEVWAKIVTAVKQGRLGPSAKVATAKPDPRARPGKHVICVYTDDAHDRDDVLRVREELRQLGFKAKLPYKADRMTLEGRYEGDGPIASYYE